MALAVSSSRRIPAPAARGALLLMLSALCFGGMLFLAKVAAARLPGPEVAAVRFAVGLLLCGGLVGARRVQLRLERSLLPLLALRGLLGGVAVVCLFTAVARGRVGTATLLNFTSPAFTAVFAFVFLRERLSPWAIGALVLAGAGVSLVLHGSGTVELGLSGWQVLGLASAILSGGAITTIRALRRERAADAWTVFATFCAAGLLCTLPVAAAGFLAPTPREWGVLLAVGVLSLAGQVVMTYALAFVKAALSGVIHQLTVVTTFALGYWFLGEPVGLWSLVGAALTITGVAWAAWLSQERAGSAAEVSGSP